MDRKQLTGLIGELGHILGVISRYRKQNQYVYLRPFESWRNGYNRIARLLTEAGLPVPPFELGADDYSPSGKSIRGDTVDRLVQTLQGLIADLEARVEALTCALEAKLAARHPLVAYFPRDDDGTPREPAPEPNLALVVLPSGEAGETLWREVIAPELAAAGLDGFPVRGLPADEQAFAEYARRLCACRLVLCALAGRDPEVLYLLGLARGLGRPLLVLQPRDVPAIAGMGDAVVGYGAGDDLRPLLRQALSDRLAATDGRGKENPDE